MKSIILIALLSATIFAKGVYATFNVVPKKEVNLAFSTNGMVSKINADIGSLVAKGEILAQLENSDLKARVNKAKAALEYATKSFKRAKKAKSVQDKATFDKFKFEYEKAKAEYILAVAILNKSYLKAPFSGIITKKAVEVGDVVSAMAPRMLFKLESKEKKLILDFDQNYLNIVKVGDTFKYKIDGQDKTYSGKIVKIYPSVDIKTHTIKAEVNAPNLKSGLFGDGLIELGAK